MYNKDNVSFGCWFGSTYKLSNGVEVVFANNRISGIESIDERNLYYCKYLNLR